MNNSIITVYALVLCGGEGRRVGHQDKGLIPYRGKPLVEWLVTALTPQVDSIVINHNRNKEAYEKLSLPLVSDDMPSEADNKTALKNERSYQGPIAGILSIQRLNELKPFDALLVCPCDTPNIPNNLVNKLCVALQENNADVAVVFDGERQQNLHCLLRAPMLNSLSAFFENGGRAIKHWLSETNTVYVDFSTQGECFANYNSLTDINSSEESGE